MRRFRLTAILFLCVGQLATQNSIIPFVNYTVEEGLPSMHVYDIIQDSKGYIWFGTDAGISRFDGYHFENFSTKDGLTNNDVFRMHEDDEGRIWLSSIQPLCYFENEKIHHVPHHDNAFQYVTSLKETKGGYWCARNFTVFWLDDSLRFSKHDFFTLPNQKLKPSRLVFAKEDSVWIYKDEMLYQWLGQTIIDSFRIEQNINYWGNLALGQLNNNLYYVTEEGLVELNRTTCSARVIVPEIKVAERIFSTENDLWVTYSGEGLGRVFIPPDGGKPQIFYYLEGIVVSSFLKDSEGNYWVATLGSGVYFIPANSNKITHLSTKEGLSRDNTTAVFIDDDNQIWVGYLSNRADKIMKNGTIVPMQLPKSLSRLMRRVLDFDLSPIHRTLLVVTDAGLYQNEADIFKRVVWQTSKSLSVSAPDNIIITTAQGTYSIKESDLKTLKDYNPNRDSMPLIEVLSKERSYAAFSDSENRIWLGDISGLKTVFPDSSVIHWKKKSNIFKALPTDILESEDGLIWVSTHGEGIVVFKDTSWFQIMTEQGLSSNICTSCTIDETGVWIGTNRGINHLHDFDFETQKMTIDIIGTSEGLLTNEIRDIAKKGDTVVVGTTKGISILSAKGMEQNEFPPKIFIKKIKINDQDTTLSDWYDLSSTQNDLHIEFVGISFRSLNNISYKYKLEGLNKDWKTTKNLHANYTTLPPGKYVFHVKALINNGLESETIKVGFQIHNHFTQSWWFITFCSILGGVLIFYLYYSFNVYLQRKNLQKVVKEQTAELSRRLRALTVSNEKLEDVNADLQKFAYVVSHDLKAPLRAISTLATFLEEDMNDRMEAEEKENMTLLKGRIKRMEALINGILEYSRVGREKMKKESVNLQKILPEIIETVEESTDKKTQITIPNNLPILTANLTSVKQVFQNLISNAVKYNDKEICRIEIFYEKGKEKHLFKIKDNGPGIPSRFRERIFQIFQTLNPRDEIESTGIGLSIVQKIVKELGHGEIWVKSEEGQGAVFCFTWEV